MSNFDLDSSTCDPILFLARNSPSSAKSNYIFFGKGKGDRVLILTFFDISMTDIFGRIISFFKFGHLQEEAKGQSWTESENFASVAFL